MPQAGHKHAAAAKTHQCLCGLLQHCVMQVWAHGHSVCALEHAGLHDLPQLHIAAFEEYASPWVLLYLELAQLRPAQLGPARQSYSRQRCCHASHQLSKESIHRYTVHTLQGANFAADGVHHVSLAACKGSQVLVCRKLHRDTPSAVTRSWAPSSGPTWGSTRLCAWARGTPSRRS